MNVMATLPALSSADWQQADTMGLTGEQFQQWKNDPARFDFAFGRFKGPDGKYSIPAGQQANYTGFVPTTGAQGRLGLTDELYNEFALRPSSFMNRYGSYLDKETGRYSIPQNLPGGASPAAATASSAPATNPGAGGAGAFQWGQYNTEPGYWGLPKMAGTAPAAQPPVNALQKFKDTNYFGLKNFGA
jgi:hypothetical protein